MSKERYAILALEKYKLVDLLDGDRLGQVTRTVHVAAAQDGDVVREQLHRDDRQNTLETVDRVWHFDEFRRVLLCLQIASFTNNDGTTFASGHLL